MLLWGQAVEILRESIFAYAQACNGNLGAGILAVTFLARLALLPLGIRMARLAGDRQRAMDAREGMSSFSVGGCLGALVQIPVFVALYSAVQQAAAQGGRFLWIRDLARVDWPMAIVATMLTLLATATGGAAPSPNRSWMLSITAAVTIAALSKMSAGVGMYWALSSLFGAVQGWAVQRRLRGSAA
jgi:membrane protein insertase Oxa1/YidC/SpoIIIJ